MKSILVVVVCMCMFFAISVSCLAEPQKMSVSNNLNPYNLERVVKEPVKQAQKYSLGSTTEESVPGIHNCIVSPVIDNNLNGFCAAIYYFIKVNVPDEGIAFKIRYYYRIWEGNEWGKWVEQFEGPVWFFSKEDAELWHIESYGYFLEEVGSIPPSKAQFMIEMYDTDDNLLDSFLVSRRRYWVDPRIESETYDDKGYLTPELTPTPVE